MRPLYKLHVQLNLVVYKSTIFNYIYCSPNYQFFSFIFWYGWTLLRADKVRHLIDSI